MSKRKNTIIIICFILVILLGAGAAAYPLIASINNEHTQSLVQTEYEEKLQQLDTSEIDAALAAAREYNKTISTVQIEDVDKIKADLPPYEDLLNLANNGIMGYIMIPAINIDLPIYHGTTGAAMEKGAGPHGRHVAAGRRYRHTRRDLRTLRHGKRKAFYRPR